MKNQKSSIISFIGAPNVGKSSLTNALVGTEVSIVNRKRQTTRFPIRGIVTKDDTQLVFVDTPGFFNASKTDAMGQAMVKSARSFLGDVDVICHVVDAATGFTQTDEHISQTLQKNGAGAWMILNKTDKAADKKLLPLLESLSKNTMYKEFFPVSATTGRGIEHLRDCLLKNASTGAWMYADDVVSDLDDGQMAAEITRGVIYDQVHDEIPYGVSVETTHWEDFKNGDIKITQQILVEKEGYKRILIGQNGNAVRLIREQSQKKLENLLEAKVHLFLEVKVDKDWKSAFIKSMA